MDNTNFNVAFILLTTDPELQADMRRYFRVVLLFEKNTFLNSIFSTIDTDEMEAPSCGKEGFSLTEEEKKTFDFKDYYCVPPGY